ncbi:zinc ribbon domain-containing protein [Bacillus marasmi]|uniref:zinc ribbon domain-containing protein n=1 Tax=Bacillus marasmi TaxID=1926279 RepID=UPI0011CB6CD3|nr:zinc ribbon domain-containing protein [Bacillus marasmi]
MSVFTGKIFCNYCMKPFRPKTIKGSTIWTCQRNDRHTTCNPTSIDEKWLISLISMRLFWDEKSYSNKLINEQLEHIVFENKNRLKIKFKHPVIDDIIFFDGSLNFGSNFRVNQLGWELEEVS